MFLRFLFPLEKREKDFFPHLPGEGCEILYERHPPSSPPHRQLSIPVGTAGPQSPAPDRSGHRRTPTASCGSQWVPPDLNRQKECQKMCRRVPDRTPEDMPDRMSEGMPDRMPDSIADRTSEDHQVPPWLKSKRD